MIGDIYKCSAKEAAKKVNDALGIYQQNDCTGSRDMRLIRSTKHWDTPQSTHQVAKTTKSIADKVIGMLKSAKQAESTYLKNKGLTGMYSILNDGSLLLPLKKLDGTITGAQIIKPNGEKKLIYGSKKSKAFIAVDKSLTAEDQPETIIITEGYATALTVDMLKTGYVVAAIDAGNLKSVAESFRSKYPDADIFIAGDNDVTEGGRSNVGKEEAEKAARAAYAQVTIPPKDYPCDWNDYFQAEGIDKLTEEFNANLRTPRRKAGRPQKEKKHPVTEFPCDLEVNEKTGKYLNTFRNLYRMACHTDITRFNFGYDTFRASEMILIKDSWMEVNENILSTFRLRLEELDVEKAPRDDTRSAVNLICEDNSFDSGIDWINSLTWDGKPRVKKFFSKYFLVSGYSEYVEAVSQYTWTALAGRMVQAGIKADMVPLLYGEQGVGKSTGIEKMCPFPDAFTKVDLTKNDEDLARKIRGCVIAEWEELRGLSGRDSESTKAFISATTDKWIPKYKEFATSNPRRLLFIGTTNKQEILTDSTGNRRYLPLDVGKVDFEAIEQDRDQLWAEALVLFKEHGIMWQKAEQLAKKEHEQYRVQDSWEDDLYQYLEIGTKKEMQFVSTEALFSRLGLIVGHTNRSHAERLKTIMNRFGYEKGIKRINNVLKRAYFKK
ncbi:VapE domain-containing protein [Arsenophonus sp.]|uniref:VapE domain-containing protein n=1 Tax=Arsenophonus sp. TaxID=1872640 RepID=UPI00387A7A78